MNIIFQRPRINLNSEQLKICYRKAIEQNPLALKYVYTNILNDKEIIEFYTKSIRRNRAAEFLHRTTECRNRLNRVLGRTLGNISENI